MKKRIVETCSSHAQCPNDSNRSGPGDYPALFGVTQARVLRSTLALMFLGLLSVTTNSVAQSEPDCGVSPEEDMNGDGYADRLVSPEAILIEADIGCFSRVGSRAILVRADVRDDSEVGERTFLAPGARLSRAVLGERSIVLNDSEIIGGLGIDKPILGDRIFLGPRVKISGRLQMAGDSVVLGGTRIDEGDYASGLIVGNDSELLRVTTGENVRIGSRSGIDFNSMLGSGTVIGNDVGINIVTELGERVQVGDRTVIGEFVDIGTDSVIGSDAVIGDFASLGTGVVVGARATIARGAMVEDFTEIAPDSTFP